MSSAMELVAIQNACASEHCNGARVGDNSRSDVWATRPSDARAGNVRKFSNERGTANAKLDVISFLDGDEKKGRAKFANEKVFIETLQRPALTWLQ